MRIIQRLRFLTADNLLFLVATLTTSSLIAVSTTTTATRTTPTSTMIEKEDFSSSDPGSVSVETSVVQLASGSTDKLERNLPKKIENEKPFQYNYGPLAELPISSIPAHITVEGVELLGIQTVKQFQICNEDDDQNSAASTDAVSKDNGNNESTPDQTITLFRNGYGLRNISILGMNIKIYVASLYSTISISKAEQIFDDASKEEEGEILSSTTCTTHQNPTILHFNFTFLRFVGQSRVLSAWTKQLDYSVTYTDYDDWENDRQYFLEMSSSRPIENYGTQSIVMDLQNGTTRIIDQGNSMGTIYGHNFQRSFLSMWFGSKAVSEELKINLLKGW